MLRNELSCPPRPFFAPGWRKKLHFQKGQHTAGARSAPLKPRKPKARAGWFAGSLRMKQSINILLRWSYRSHPSWLQSRNTLSSTRGGRCRAPSLSPSEQPDLHPWDAPTSPDLGRKPQEPLGSKPAASGIQKRRRVPKWPGRREACFEPWTGERKCRRWMD